MVVAAMEAMMVAEMTAAVREAEGWVRATAVVVMAAVARAAAVKALADLATEVDQEPSPH